MSARGLILCFVAFSSRIAFERHHNAKADGV